MKLTYTIIAGLIVVLGAIAYLLQDNTTPVPSLPITQTQNYGTVDSAYSSKNSIKNTNSTTTVTTTTSTTTTTMETKITSATITTNKGSIEISFGTSTPVTVKNFAKLATAGFYNGVRFHRVIKDFMIQAGDPLSKDSLQKNVWGTGGPGYKFDDELTGKEKYPQGTLAMANAGPNTNGSQFFIVTASPGAPLPPSYTVFGHVTKGLDIALKIQDVKTDVSDKPLEDVIIEKVEIK